MPIDPRCGVAIRQACRGAGMSQQDLAKAIKVNTQTVSNWISGKKPVPEDRVRQIAELTGRPLSWFGLE